MWTAGDEGIFARRQPLRAVGNALGVSGPVWPVTHEGEEHMATSTALTFPTEQEA